VSLDGLNLDGTGGNDDAVTVTSYLPGEERTVVEVSLGDGRTLTREYAYACFPAVMAGNLTSTERQSVVAEMDVFGSTYGFAAYFVLEVERDALVERACLGGAGEPSALNQDGDTQGGGEIIQWESIPLEALRVPTCYGKWDDSLYGILYWDGTAFAFQLDAIAPISSEPHPSEPDLDAEAREAYALALENLVKRHVFPDGTECGSAGTTYGGMKESSFLTHDVDGDGLDELVIYYRDTGIDGMLGLVLGYDPITGRVYTELNEFSTFTFYPNGAVSAEWSHAQGSWTGGPFWPYTMYAYRSETDSYEAVGNVDAWYKSVSDGNPGILPPFPTELDISGTGVLYIISPGDDAIATSQATRDDLVDASVYQEWLDECTGGTQPLDLAELPLTMDNINRLRLGDTHE